MNLNSIKESMLLVGLSDYMHLGDPIFRITGGFPLKKPLPEGVREQSLQIIKELLAEGLIEAGSLVNRDPRFEPWNLSPRETIIRIEEKWDELDPTEIANFIVWFRLTPSGQKVAEEIQRQLDDTL